MPRALAEHLHHFALEHRIKTAAASCCNPVRRPFHPQEHVVQDWGGRTRMAFHARTELGLQRCDGSQILSGVKREHEHIAVSQPGTESWFLNCLCERGLASACFDLDIIAARALNHRLRCAAAERSLPDFDEGDFIAGVGFLQVWVVSRRSCRCLARSRSMNARSCAADWADPADGGLVQETGLRVVITPRTMSSARACLPEKRADRTIASLSFQAEEPRGAQRLRLFDKRAVRQDCKSKAGESRKFSCRTGESLRFEARKSLEDVTDARALLQPAFCANVMTGEHAALPALGPDSRSTSMWNCWLGTCRNRSGLTAQKKTGACG
jgi:hypothetical protein